MRMILLYAPAVGYTILGHNYEDKVADDKVRGFRALGKPAYHLGQKGTHKGDCHNCRTCTRAVERMKKR